MKPSKYFANASEYFQENFLSADGFRNGSAAWRGLDGGYDEMQSQLYAEGNNAGAVAAPLSQPYIIKMENTTSLPVSNVVILDSAARVNNYAQAGISITYDLPGITYTQFLARINSGQTFMVGKVRLVASSTVSGNADAQVITTFTITTKSITGNSATMPIPTYKDNYQQVTNQVDSNYQFMVDSMVSMTFASILGNTTLKVFLFPQAATNPFNALKQGTGVNVFENPGINPLLQK